MTVCDLVCRVYLDAKILTGIDKLDEQGELIAEALVVLLTDKTTLLFAYKLVQALTLFFPVSNDSLVILHTGYLPTFTDALQFCV